MRNSVAMLVVLGLVAAGLSTQTVGVPAETAATVVQKWQPVDLTFASTHVYANPYQDMSMSATFIGPNHASLIVPGFSTGRGTWIERFSPTTTGTWTYVTSSADAQLNGKTGTITAVANNISEHGQVRIDPNNRHHYLYQDGTHYLQFEYEADWLALMDFGDPAIPKAAELIDMISANGFNEVLLDAYAYDTPWKPGKTGPYNFGPPAQYAWAGSNAKPDQSRMNEPYWQNFDHVINYLYQKGITAHIFFKRPDATINWPAKESANDDQYFKYIIARYQAYPNVIWDFSKEVYREKDQSYIANRLTLIGNTDAYHHLRTIHDPDASATNGGYMNNPAIASQTDFLTDQHTKPYTTIYSDAVGKRNRFNMPITNSENSYQIGNDGGHTYFEFQSAEVVLTNTVEVLMAGAYPGYYYTYHAWDVIRYNEVPDGIAKYRNLVQYLRTKTSWDTLAPDDALIGGGGVTLSRHLLARVGHEYLGYLNGGGNLTLSIDGANAPLHVQWYNVDTGAAVAAPNVGNGTHVFTSPWAGLALLHIS